MFISHIPLREADIDVLVVAGWRSCPSVTMLRANVLIWVILGVPVEDASVDSTMFEAVEAAYAAA